MVLWDVEKAFGLIQPDDGGARLYCTIDGLQPGVWKVAEGAEVSYMISSRLQGDAWKVVEATMGYAWRGRWKRLAVLALQQRDGLMFFPMLVVRFPMRSSVTTKPESTCSAMRWQ